MTWFERAAIFAAVSYLVVLGWAMQHLEYALWGALVTGPVLVLISVPLINRTFRGSLAFLRPIAYVGLIGKFGGAVAGYFIRSGAYGGFADANRYHLVGSLLAESVRSGRSTPLAVLPVGSNTEFIEELTGLVYTIFGSSKLGGYLVFAWMSYFGVVLTLKAGIIAVPGLARRRYAALLFLLPTLLYWGSSIGKEAVVGLFLGMIALGVAIAFSDDRNRQTGIIIAAAGTVGTAMVRPHFAAVWVGAAGIAFAVRLIRNMASRDHHGSKFGAMLMLGLAGIGFVAVSMLTLNYLDPNQAEIDDEAAVTDRISEIFNRTEDRTTTGSSTFDVVSTATPLHYPYAAFRTLTRPLIIESGSLTELLPASEMTVLLLLALVSWRRFASLPRLLFTNPYVVFAVVCVFTFGVAFTNIGNLGILVRQRSLIFPLMLLMWCLPEYQPTQAPPLPASWRSTQPASIS